LASSETSGYRHLGMETYAARRVSQRSLASATETMTRELVGSSAGEPNLTLILGRPPLLHDTLELRVREPLGQEARDALLAEDKNLVKSSEPDLPGDWVLWKQVIDPADEDPGARVYALDDHRRNSVR